MSDSTQGPTIQSISSESRLFEPPAEFARAAHIPDRATYDERYAQSIEDPDAFWDAQAKAFHWFKPYAKVCEWNPPHAQYFVGGETNLAYNCLDHQLEDRGEKTAILWEGEPGDVRKYTYRELHAAVCRCANALEKLGITKGDRVGIYLGMVPEAAISMLACARIGAIHTVIFGGFAADSVRDRLNDAEAKLVITQDGSWRRGKVVPLKEQVDHALAEVPSVEHVIVLHRTKHGAQMQEGRDLDWDALMEGASSAHEAVPLDAEHPLYILYTSGTTGRPKGVLHTTGGYMVGCAVTTKYAFDLKEDDVYWCTADVGWVTGHSYIVYGPLCNGATVLMYEGAPNQPDPGRFWEIIAKHRVSILYTAPTAIRAFIKWGDEWLEKHDLSSLRLLGSVGEPINPEAWIWYRDKVGGQRCPVIDTWWQTETGAIMMTPLPGAIAAKPGSCTLPFFGISPKILHEDGTEAGPNEGGLLVIDKPWPSMLRTIWGDDERFREQYFSRFEGIYFTGDGARRDEDGYFWVMGRVDDVVNVSGHRLGTAEIESVLVEHDAVAEAAVVGRPDPLKGQALVAFVTIRSGVARTEELRAALVEKVAVDIGKFARPEELRFAGQLPKTRSGKIMRRLLKELAASGDIKGDVTTLEDAGVIDKLKNK